MVKCEIMSAVPAGPDKENARMDKREREEQRHQEDRALQQGMLWAAGAAVLEVLLFLFNRFGLEFDATMEGVTLAERLLGLLPALRIVGIVACVAGGAVWFLQMKKGGKRLWAGVAAVAGLAVGLCAHTVDTYGSSGMRMLYLLVPVMGGLILCYYIYPRDFFLSALPVVSAVLGLWYVRAGGLGVELVLTALICAAAVLAVFALKKGDGMVKLGDTELNLLPQKTVYTVPVISAAAALAVLAVGAVAGGMAAYYLIFAMGAWLFALLVYFTVKML